MTNWQKYEKEIQKAVSEVLTFDRETKSFCICDENNSFNPPCECFNCYFKGTEERSRAFLKWANAEAKEEILISEDERNILIAMYHKGYRYIARDYLILSNRTEPTYSIAVFTFEPENSFCEQAQPTDSSRRNYYWTTGENIDNKGCRLYAFEDWFQFVRPQKPELIMDLINRAVVRENRTGEGSGKNDKS